MSKNLRAIYFATTEKNTWAKALTISDACHLAGVKKGVRYAVTACVLDNPEDEELTRMYNFVTCDEVNGTPQYCKWDDFTDEEKAFINRLHVGWLLLIDES